MSLMSVQVSDICERLTLVSVSNLGFSDNDMVCVFDIGVSLTLASISDFG